VHQVLKKVSSSYVLCADCFTQGNFPQILSADDFEKSNLDSLLMTEHYKALIEQYREEGSEDQVWTE